MILNDQVKITERSFLTNSTSNCDSFKLDLDETIKLKVRITTPKQLHLAVRFVNDTIDGIGYCQNGQMYNMGSELLKKY